MKLAFETASSIDEPDRSFLFLEALEVLLDQVGLLLAVAVLGGGGVSVLVPRRVHKPCEQEAHDQ